MRSLACCSPLASWIQEVSATGCVDEVSTTQRGRAIFNRGDADSRSETKSDRVQARATSKYRLPRGEAQLLEVRWCLPPRTGRRENPWPPRSLTAQPTFWTDPVLAC